MSILLYYQIWIFFSIYSLLILISSSHIPNSIRHSTQVCITQQCALLSTLIYPYPSFSRDDNNNALSLSLEQAVQLILSSCTTMVQASRLTGRLLYRGEGGGEQCIINTAKTSPPDLLDNNNNNNSYSSFASEYFNSLNDELVFRSDQSVLSYLSNYTDNNPHLLLKYPSAPVLESVTRIRRDRLLSVGIAHIASADIQVASQWGVPVSVWPFDSQLHYAWLKNENTWWNDEWTRSSRQNAVNDNNNNNNNNKRISRRPFFWRSKQLLNDFMDSEIRFDNGLETALSLGKEVMFHCDYKSFGNSYLTIPLSQESKLLKALNIIPYSSSAKVNLARPMEMDGRDIKRRRIPLPKSSF